MHRVPAYDVASPTVETAQRMAAIGKILEWPVLADSGTSGRTVQRFGWFIRRFNEARLLQSDAMKVPDRP